MIISIIPIGNSKGIRLPKTVLEQLNITDKMEMKVDNEQIVLKPVQNKPRAGWAEAFQEMHKNNDDSLILKDEQIEETFEWEW